MDVVLKEMKSSNGTVIAVGDGINDAPVLAAAHVGVAMGARGATAASEAADIVIVDDSIDRLTQAITIAKFSRKKALQAAGVGMGLSFVAMSLGATADVQVPGFVYGIIISLFIFFNSFALVQYLQYKGKGKWSNYLRGERAYIVLSLVAKSALAWQIFSGTLIPAMQPNQNGSKSPSLGWVYFSCNQPKRIIEAFTPNIESKATMSAIPQTWAIKTIITDEESEYSTHLKMF